MLNSYGEELRTCVNSGLGLLAVEMLLIITLVDITAVWKKKFSTIS